MQLKKELANERKQNKLLKKNIKQLERQNKITVNKKINEILKNVFTPQQIRKIMHPQKKRVKWEIEDIASAIALRSVSPKA